MEQEHFPNWGMTGLPIVDVVAMHIGEMHVKHCVLRADAIHMRIYVSSQVSSPVRKSPLNLKLSNWSISSNEPTSGNGKNGSANGLIHNYPLRVPSL